MNSESGLLYDLYITSSPSGHEYGIQGIIIRELNKMGIPFMISSEGHIYNIKPNQVILSAHMDQVFFTQPLDIKRDSKGRIFASNKTSLGADDKNGIFIVLQLLKEFPESGFCFSVREEIGGDLWFSTDIIKKAKKAAFCIVFDRKGNSDIIGASNGYCTESFENSLSDILVSLQYCPNTGVFSDANFFSQYINSVNLSCGFYNAHTPDEYAVWADILKAVKAGKLIIQNQGILKKAKAQLVLGDKVSFIHSRKTSFQEDSWDIFFKPESRRYLKKVDYNY